MPYVAWLAIVPSVRAAREAGLFGDWAKLPFHRQRKRYGARTRLVTRADCDPAEAGSIPVEHPDLPVSPESERRFPTSHKASSTLAGETDNLPRDAIGIAAPLSME